jgi:hypothetical protein
MITQSRLKQLLAYDPETGVFRRVCDQGRWKKGSIAGSTDDASGSSGGYVKIYVDGRRYRAHRLAWMYMTGAFPSSVDHINHDRSDNRWLNLRMASQPDNAKNRKMNSNNSSGFRGVSWYKPSGKWMAYINTAPGKRKNLGYFDTILDAVAERVRAERHYEYHENHGA